MKYSQIRLYIPFTGPRKVYITDIQAHFRDFEQGGLCAAYM